MKLTFLAHSTAFNESPPARNQLLHHNTLHKYNQLKFLTKSNLTSNLTEMDLIRKLGINN